MAASKKVKSGTKAASSPAKKASKTAVSPKSTNSKTIKKPTAKATPARPPAAAKPVKMEKSTKTPSVKRTAAEASKPAASAKPARPEPAEPKMPKIAVDPELLKAIREALVSQRNQLLSVMHNTQAQLADKETGMADVSDRASGGFEDELAMGLMQIEAAQIEDIEAAIRRIDNGTYGICDDCMKLIPRKRLEVLPFALRCLECEGTKERRARMQSMQEDEPDNSSND